MSNKVAEKMLGAVAAASGKVAAAADGDWCWLWGYKPELPACMKQDEQIVDHMEEV